MSKVICMYHTVQHSCCSLPLVDSLAFPLQKINGLKPSSSLTLNLRRGYTCTHVLVLWISVTCLFYKNELYELLPTQTIENILPPYLLNWASALQIAKFMFPSLFSTSSQMYSYDIRTVKSYRPHHCCTILISSLQYFTRVLKFGILSQYRALVRLAFLAQFQAM